MEERPTDSSSPKRARRIGARLADGARNLDKHPRLVVAAKIARELLPGDSRYGDPLSTAGSTQPDVVGRRLADVTAERPGVLREAGLSALQVWQALSEAQGRGRGKVDLAIVFTDLVEFSTWALEAGDDLAVELLRDVGEAIEPPVKRRGGEVVKRLGDGMMAVFAEPQAGLEAVMDAMDRLRQIDAPGYDAKMRAGMHVGRARQLGGDYLGVDVNIAARVAEEAGGGELLVSDRALAKLDQDALDVRKRRFFKVKGVPKDVTTYSIALRG